MRRKALTSFDANQWNGLRVTLAASGVARYEPGDMTPLYQRWSSVVGAAKP
jgi:urease beta subunit